MSPSAVLAAATGTSSTTGVQHLSGADKVVTLAIVVGFVLLAGLVIVIGRRSLDRPRAGSSTQASGPGALPGQGETSDSTLVRSWLAISLVGGLLIFVAVSFWLDDTTLRSTLVGGVVANAGAAVAFYFASKSSDQARRDILSATLPAAVVPNLVGKDLAAAHEAVAAIPLRLEVQPATPLAGAQVVSQAPAANQSAPSGSALTATLAGPVPDLSGLTQEQAQAKLTAAGLQLDPDPPKPDANSKLGSQQPPAGGAVPTNLKVKGKFGSTAVRIPPEA